MTDATPPQPEADDVITEDCSCVNCGHNLHGLRESDLCPSCHEPVTTTLELAADEQLCINCMKPNPPISDHCSYCGAALNSAAACADQAIGRILPNHITSQYQRRMDDLHKQDRTNLLVALVQYGLACLILLFSAFVYLYDRFSSSQNPSISFKDSRGSPIMLFVFLFVFGLVIIMATYRYFESRKAMKRQKNDDPKQSS